MTLTDDLIDTARGIDLNTKPLQVAEDGNTPYSDAIFNMVAESDIGKQEGLLPDEVPRMPPEIQGSLNIGAPADAPAIVTEDGLHIYNADHSEARRIQLLKEEFPDLWVDKGPIDQPEEDQMTVPLIDGWQTAKLNSQRYPVSKLAEAAIDEIHGRLTSQGRLTEQKGVCPFAIPIFVVWRQVHGVKKARVVVDLRILNKWAVPDNYPLPLQSDVIDASRGKKYLSIMDATSFFFQLLVHKHYRDRFTLISHRGLEQMTVVPMGFRNSPAHAQRFMDRTLKPHKHFCKAFIDDIVIFSDTFEDHVAHLRTIFNLFLKLGVSISPQKSYLGYPSIELLGFYVDSLGLTTTKERTQGFRDMVFPSTLKALETYLGSTGFLRTMIPYYAKLSEPLQRRKVQLLAAGRKSGNVVNGQPGKRQAYASRTKIEPTPEELQAFNDIQRFVTEELRLYHHDPAKQLFLQVDGSLERGFGVMVFHTAEDYVWTPGATIPAHVVKPIMFLSRCLTKAELNYGPSEMEVACLVWACKRLRPTIHSNSSPVVVLTDHDATKGIVNQTRLNTTSTDRSNRRLINASIYLSEYQLDVHHLAGRLNLVPDALSRLAAQGDDAERAKPDTPVLDAVFDHLPPVNLVIAEAQMSPDMRHRFRLAYKNDTTYNAIIQSLVQPDSSGRKPAVTRKRKEVVSASKPGYAFRLVDGLLYNRDESGTERLVIPYDLVQEFLADAHDQKHHFGRDRMMADLDGVHFKRKRFLVDLYVRKCHRCGELRKDNQLPIGNLQPIQAPEEPMHTVAIDFVVGLPEVPSKGTPWDLGGKHTTFNAFMSTTDKTSKRRMILPGHTSYTAVDWATVFARYLLLADWSCPKVIISDRDAKFLSAFWQTLWKAFGTKLAMTTAYHPQADGQSESTNHIVELAIRHYCVEYAPDFNWIDVLPSLQWNLNNAHVRAIDASPHEYLYGFKIQAPADRLKDVVPKQAADIRFMRQHLRRDAQLTMNGVSAESKQIYDAKHRPLEFNIGNQVWLKYGKAYKPLFRGSKKTTPPRGGPFKIIRKVTPLAYELDFDKDDPVFRGHPVISIQYLLPYEYDDDPFSRQPPKPEPVVYGDKSSATEQGEHFEVEKILDKRIIGRKKAVQYLVRWKGATAAEDRWHTLPQLRRCQELIAEYEKAHGNKVQVSVEPDTVLPQVTTQPKPKPKPKAKPKAKSPAPDQEIILDKIVIKPLPTPEKPRPRLRKKKD